jgi:GTP-binding protein
MPPLIAIIGRPNVGKSTLFNRLTRSRDALVDDAPGITRDRIYGTLRWEGVPMTLADTGGLDDAARDPLSEGIREQVDRAISEAQVLLFLVDGRQGAAPGDREIADRLRRTDKPVLLLVNKVDGPENDHLVSDFLALGFERVFPVSAAHGYGIKALMAELVRHLPQGGEDGEEARSTIAVAFIGRPNVGKSSLINRILGENRLLVSDLPGTTRDSVDTAFSWKGQSYLLIDTAGIRRRPRVRAKIEKFSVVKALQSLERCDVAVILLDAGEGVSEQDARICRYAFDRGRGIVLAVNKWDLMGEDPEKVRGFREGLTEALRFVSFAPRVYLSALTGAKVMAVFDRIQKVYRQYSLRLNTGQVNRVVHQIFEGHPPPKTGRGRAKFFYATQAETRPPTFVLFVNQPDLIPESYERFLIHRLRAELQLSLCVLRVKWKKK